MTATTTTTETKTRATTQADRPEPQHSTPKRMHLMRYWAAIVDNRLTDASTMAQNHDVARADRAKALKYIEWHEAVQAGPPSKKNIDSARDELNAAQEAVHTAERALARAEEATFDPPTPEQWREVLKAETQVKSARERTAAAVKNVNHLKGVESHFENSKHQLREARRASDVDVAYVLAALAARD